MTLLAPGVQAHVNGIVEKLAVNDQARERLDANVPAFWMMQATQSANLVVVALRTMLDAIALELGNLDEAVTPVPEGDYHQRMSTRLQALRALQTLTQTQLTQVSASNSAAPAWGLMTATTPRPVPVWAADPNSPAYKGDPLLRPWWTYPT